MKGNKFLQAPNFQLDFSYGKDNIDKIQYLLIILFINHNIKYMKKLIAC